MQKTLNAFFQPSTSASTAATVPTNWRIVDVTLLTGSFGTIPSSLNKVAAFDLDSTLIVPKSGATHPKNGSDWKWLNANVKPKLQELSKTHLVVIFSNQGGVVPREDTKRYQYIREKFQQMSKDLSIPLQFFAATKTLDDTPNVYRKPNPQMWNYFRKSVSGIDMANSFYVGDAAGRATDFSDSDKSFAEAIGVEFYTPEMFFL